MKRHRISVAILLPMFFGFVILAITGCGGGGGGGGNGSSETSLSTVSNNSSVGQVVDQTFSHVGSLLTSQNNRLSQRRSFSLFADTDFSKTGVGTEIRLFSNSSNTIIFGLPSVYESGEQIIQYQDENGSLTDDSSQVNSIVISCKNLRYSFVSGNYSWKMKVNGNIAFSGFKTKNTFLVSYDDISFQGNINGNETFSWSISGDVSIAKNNFPYPNVGEKVSGTLSLNSLQYSYTISYDGTYEALCRFSGPELVIIKLDLRDRTDSSSPTSPEDTDPVIVVPPTTLKPDALFFDASPLAKNQTAQLGFSNRQLALSVPADGSSRRYGVVVTAENPVAGKAFRLLGNGGGGTKLTSLRAESLLERNPAFPNQAAADAVMRGYRPRTAPGGSVPRASIMAANTSAEKVGDEITFNAYSGGYFGSSYTTRKGVLRRRGQYCKIFVDPDVYQGLSAVNPGPYQVTEADLDAMQTRFDQTIYPFITQNYGNTFDKDSDGRVTIFLSPLYTKLGFAGLFDPAHLSDKAVENLSNERDMFVIFTPDASFNGQTWQKVALETVCHEFQHLANYVARRVAGNKPNEEAWLDEALSVGAEARYRILTGDTPGEDRFRSYLQGLRSTSLTNFNMVLANYGAGGLFTTYLFDRAGADPIKALVQSDMAGIANVNANYASYGGFTGVFRSWAQALFVECHRSLVDFSTLEAGLKYANNLDLTLENTTPRIVSSSPFETTMTATSLFFAILEPTSSTSDGLMTITLEDPDGASMTCSLIRLR